MSVALNLNFLIPRVDRGYKFSSTSLARLETCHPDLQLILHYGIKWLDISIFCGHRGEEEQNKAYVEGKSGLRWPDSKHNKFPSMAVDCGPYFKELRNTDWEDFAAFAMMADRLMFIAELLYEAGEIQHKLRWGGDWDGDRRTADHRFRDGPHIELYNPVKVVEG